MTGVPLSLISGVFLLIAHTVLGIDTLHRIPAGEKNHKASSRVVLGIDAKGVVSHADAQRVSSTPVGEAVARAVPHSETDGLTSQDATVESTSSELSTSLADADIKGLPAQQPSEDPPAEATDPSAGQSKAMMRKEPRRKPIQANNSSELELPDVSSSLLQVESSPAGLCMTEVKSAALDVGNFATFKLNGRMVNPPTGRGFNVLVVSEDWTEQDEFRVFDTCGRRGDNQEMMDFLMELREGACILVAVKDDATMQITSQSRLALENFGATQAFDIGYRNSYALIGCKGQPRIKEVVVGRDVGPTPWLCPERCEWGEWGEWEECSATCGGGEERRTRERAQEGEPGGWPCEGEPHETRACGEDACATTTNTTTTSLMLLFPSGAQRLHLGSALALVALAATLPIRQRL